MARSSYYLSLSLSPQTIFRYWRVNDLEERVIPAEWKRRGVVTALTHPRNSLSLSPSATLFSPFFTRTRGVGSRVRYPRGKVPTRCS